jgi:hypothetical protein
MPIPEVLLIGVDGRTPYAIPGFSGRQDGAMLQSMVHTKIIVAAIAVVVIGAGVYAFTASNTVPASTAGAGNGVVSGYTVTNIHYNLDATTPTNIDSLTFTISPVVPSTGTGRVVVQTTLSTGGPNTYTCTTDTTGATVTCPTITPTQLTAALVTGVTVIAAQ